MRSLRRLAEVPGSGMGDWRRLVVTICDVSDDVPVAVVSLVAVAADAAAVAASFAADVAVVVAVGTDVAVDVLAAVDTAGSAAVFSAVVSLVAVAAADAVHTVFVDGVHMLRGYSVRYRRIARNASA